MAENKKSFILYADQGATFENLPDDVAGKLIKTIFAYVQDKNPIPDDLLLKIAFEPIKQQLKRDLKDWKTKLKARSEAGKKGMAARWDKDNKAITKDNIVIPVITKITDNVIDIVNDNVIEKDKTLTIFSIEHCLMVAMNDPRWVKANKVVKTDLEEFNRMLERRGVYDKNPADYKTHYANWKANGKKDDVIPINTADEFLRKAKQKAQ